MENMYFLFIIFIIIIVIVIVIDIQYFIYREIRLIYVGT